MPESNLTRPSTAPEKLDPRVELWVFGVEHAQVTDVTGGDNEHGDYASIGLTIGTNVELTLAAATPEALARFATTLAEAATDRRRYRRPNTD